MASALTSNVSSLAQAIGSFTEASASSASTSTAAVNNGGTAASAPATLAVAGMVSTMQQFNANGQAATTSAAAAPTATTALVGQSVQNPNANNILASGGKT